MTDTALGGILGIAIGSGILMTGFSLFFLLKYPFFYKEALLFKDESLFASIVSWIYLVFGPVLLIGGLILLSLLPRQ